jgi:hypothetical protein
MKVIYKCETKEERVQNKEEVNRGILIGCVNKVAKLEAIFSTDSEIWL